MDESNNRMDLLILQLLGYRPPIMNIQTATLPIPDDEYIKNIEIKKNEIPKETPEYYANETHRFLTDICDEKSKKIKIINILLNVSIIANGILLYYLMNNNAAC